MGNFLDTPITTKETEVGENRPKSMTYGLSAMQGWRAQMEDDHLHYFQLHDNVRAQAHALALQATSVRACEGRGKSSSWL